MNALLLIAALTGSPENCLVGETHLYVSANIERFPAIGSEEIDSATAKRIAKEGGTYFEITVNVCSKQPASLIKLQAGKPLYGYYYRYQDGHLVGLDLRYIDGVPTTQEVMDHI